MKDSIVVVLAAVILIPSIALAQGPSSRDELLTQLIAVLMQQVKTLQDQLLQLQASTTPKAERSVPITSTDRGATYLAKDGNWYYSKAYGADGKKLQVMTATISGASGSSTRQEVVEEYPAFPVLAFDLTGTTDYRLERLAVRFAVSGNARVTTAYLYQGETVPLASAKLSKNVATFVVPVGTSGASFGPGIPTRFTIKADIKNEGITTVSLPVCPEYNYRVKPANRVPKEFRFTSTSTIETSIKAVDVELYDRSDSPPGKLFGAPVEADFVIPASRLTSCYDPWRRDP